MTRKLDRLNASNSTGVAFQRLWQRSAETIESTFGSLQDQITAIAAAQAAAAAAQGTANTAITNAAAAQTTADTAHDVAAIGLGWTSPGQLLSSTDNGTNANVVIASHTRHYGDGTSVAVTGATITGAYGTTFYTYYDDNNRTGGAVSFHATTNPNTAADNASSGRHYCGKVLTTTSGGGATTGGGTVPPGGDYTGPGEIP